MMFPPIRISKLEFEMESRKRDFENSRNQLLNQIKSELTLTQFLKRNPDIWVGAAVSLVSAGGAGKLLGMMGRQYLKNSKAKRGMISKFVLLFVRVLKWTVFPFAAKLFKKRLDEFLHRGRFDEI